MKHPLPDFKFVSPPDALQAAAKYGRKIVGTDVVFGDSTTRVTAYEWHGKLYIVSEDRAPN